MPSDGAGEFSTDGTTDISADISAGMSTEAASSTSGELMLLGIAWVLAAVSAVVLWRWRLVALNPKAAQRWAMRGAIARSSDRKGEASQEQLRLGVILGGLTLLSFAGLVSAGQIGVLLVLAVGLPVAAGLGGPRVLSCAGLTGTGKLVGDALRGLAGFVLVYPFIMVASLIAVLLKRALTGEGVEELGHQTLRDMRSMAFGELAITVFFVVVLVPVLEELMFRGLMQPALCRAGQAIGLGLRGAAWLGIALTSVVFALVHVGIADLHTLPMLLVLSAGFGVLTERTGRLWPAAFMHAWFNAANVGLALLVWA